MTDITKAIEHFTGSTAELITMKTEAASAPGALGRQYYKITYGDEDEVFCPVVLVEELDFIIGMASRVSTRVKVFPLVENMMGFDTYITTYVF